MKFTIISTDDIKLHCVSQGSGKLLLFLHGFPEFWYQWKNQFADLSTDYLVVAPDLRGFNLSSKPEALEQYAMRYLVSDVLRVLQHFQYEQCVLIGHDIGGAIATCFAEQYPEKVEKLILINTTHPAVFQHELQHNPLQQAASAYMQLLKNPRAEKIISDHHYAYFWHYMMLEVTEKKLFSVEDIKRYEAAWTMPGALTGMLNYYRSWPWKMDFSNRLPPNILTKTLVIWGDKDRALTLDILRAFQDYFFNLSVSRLSECSHWLIHENPAVISHLIDMFA